MVGRWAGQRSAETAAACGQLDAEPPQDADAWIGTPTVASPDHGRAPVDGLGPRSPSTVTVYTARQPECRQVGVRVAPQVAVCEGAAGEGGEGRCCTRRLEPRQM